MAVSKLGNSEMQLEVAGGETKFEKRCSLKKKSEKVKFVTKDPNLFPSPITIIERI